MENNSSKVIYSMPLEIIGIITGIVLCILQSTGVIDIGWFWATFPFWIVIAVDVALVLLIMFIALIIAGIAYLID